MFTLPPLPYGYDALEPWIDTETMKLHHDKHHQAYVDNLNKALEKYPEYLEWPIEEIITKLDKIPEEVRVKVHNNSGGHFNHSLFWTMMAPNPQGHSDTPIEAKDTLTDAIVKSFSDFPTFKEKFSNTALNHFGSGWAWLIKEDRILKIEESNNQDNPLMNNPKIKVLLGLDVWEHAYYLKYQNRRKEYIEAWWNTVNWDEVENRLQET